MESLKGCPTEVDSFYCENNPLEEIDFFPKVIKKSIFISENKLKELKNLPSYVNGSLSCEKNQLTSFKGFPSEIKAILNISGNPIENFEGIENYKNIKLDNFLQNLILKNLNIVKKINESIIFKKILISNNGKTNSFEKNFYIDYYKKFELNRTIKNKLNNNIKVNNNKI